MASISATGSKGHHKFTLTVTEKSTSVESNSSILDATLSLASTSYNWADWGSAIKYSITIGDKSYSGSIPEIPQNKAYTIKTITGAEIAHNEDGTKVIDLKFSITDGADKYYTCGDAEAEGTMTLTTIDRVSVITSATDPVNIGSTCAIAITKKTSTFTSTLEYQIENTNTWTSIASAYNPNTNLTQTYNWTVPTSIYNSMAAAEKEKKITIRLKTMNSSTQVGNASAVEIIVKATGSPSISSSSVVDTNTKTVELTGSNAKIVTGVSNVKITVNAAGVNGSTISKITCNGAVMTLSGNTGTHTINECSEGVFAIVVTDSRGATCSTTLDKSSSLIKYVPLSAVLSAEKDQPTSASAILKAEGNYSETTFASGKVNTLTTTYQYRLANTSNTYISGNLTQTKKNETYTATTSISGLDYTKDYEVKITVADRLYSLTDTIILKKGVPVLYWDKDAVYLKSGNQILDYAVTSTSAKAVQLKDKSGKEVYPNPFPIGSIYVSIKETSPSSIFGGSWEKITDKFLYATSATGDAGKNGGSSTISYTPTGSVTGTVASHTLTMAQMPTHNHVQSARNPSDGSTNPAGGNKDNTDRVGAGVEWKACSWQNANQQKWADGWTMNTYSRGSSEGHNHGFSGTFTGTTASLTVNPAHYTVHAWVRIA